MCIMTVVNDTFCTLTVVNRTFCKDGISVIFCIKLMLSAEILSRQVFEEKHSEASIMAVWLYEPLLRHAKCDWI